jgi:AAA domain
VNDQIGSFMAGVTVGQPPPPPPPVFTPVPYVWQPPATIPPRKFVYGRHYIRENLGVTVAPGAVGKSTLVLVEALAMVTGRNLLGVQAPKPRKVWYVNLEDSRTEIERRIAAICLYFSIDPDDIGDRLCIGGRETEIVLATQTKTGGVIAEPVFDALKSALLAGAFDVLVLDPFISAHRVTENDNPAIDAIAKKLGRLAEETNTAVELVHHVRKTNGQDISTEDARGASALINAARAGRALNRMSEDEAKAAGINDNRRRYFRIDDTDGKNNLTAPSDNADWYRLVSVDLGNAQGDDPQDQIGVTIAWEWPDAFAGVTVDHLDAIKAKIRAGEWRADVRSQNWAGYAVAEVLALDAADPAHKAKIKGLLKQWIRSKALIEVERQDDSRHQRTFIEAGSTPACF